MSHGSRRTTRTKPAGRGASRETLLEADQLAGFGHWPQDPEPGQQCQLTRSDDWPHLAEALARALFGEYHWPPDPPAPGPIVARDDNWKIPAGYTYLLQFISHDLVNTRTPLWALPDGVGTANTQSDPLQLYVLYGGGPSVCPHAFVPNGPTGPDRYRLRLSKFAADAGGGVISQFSDLPRTPVDGVNETLVADPRNTDNAVLAQVTVLFSVLHNLIAQSVANGATVMPLPNGLRGPAIFEHARSIVTGLYRRVIFRDVLPKILHPAVYQAYAKTSKAFRAKDKVALELSHAVMRFGHAMVRDRYVMRTSGLSISLLQSLFFNTVAEGGALPLPPVWLAQWSCFFPSADGVLPNYSRRIGPGMSTSLFNPTAFEPIGESSPLGLPYRDFKSSFLAGLWSVDALIKAIRGDFYPCPIPDDWPFLDAAKRSAMIEGWLCSQNTRLNLELKPVEINAIAADPPLLLFTLLEAAFDPQVNGLHLGALASVILADQLYGFADPAETMDLSVLRPGDRAEVDGITDIDGCIRFVEKRIRPAILPFFESSPAGAR